MCCVLCAAQSLACTLGLLESRSPGCRLGLVRLSQRENSKLEGEKEYSHCALSVAAAFAASESLARRSLRGPGNFPEVHTRSAPYWASALGLLLLHQVWKVTRPRPHPGSKRVPSQGLEAFPGGPDPEAPAGGSAHFGLLFLSVLGNSPQQLARQTQRPRLGKTLRPGSRLLPLRPPQEDGRGSSGWKRARGPLGTVVFH